MPKSVQGKAKQLIHEMYLAPTRKAALAAYDQFISSYQSKFVPRLGFSWERGRFSEALFRGSWRVGHGAI
jgi:transposase-like protein